MSIRHSVLQAIGNTPSVQLRKVVAQDHARVFIKLESANPTGSMKDRMAKGVIEMAEENGQLAPGGTVVECTGGSTGTSLALVCAGRGYRLRVVTSDEFSQEKLDHMEAHGAQLTIIPSEGGRITKELFEKMIETARRISEDEGAYWTDQFGNARGEEGYYSLGEEIWAQTNGEIDAFVQCVGTAHSFQGTARTLRRHRPAMKTVAVEPAESPVLSRGRAGAHGIEGIGIGFLPPLWEPTLADEIATVSTVDAIAMTRRLAREEALFGGTSSGANVVAALRIAERLGPEATVVTLMVDSGLKYLSTDLYGSE